MEATEARSEATFRYTIQNFNSLKKGVDFSSPPFYVRNLPWNIMVMLSQEANSLGFYLQCNAKSQSSSWSCYAEAELRLLSHKPDIKPFGRNIQHLFYNEKFDWGFRHFIDLNVVSNPDNGYIKNNSISVEVHLTAEEPHGVPKKLKKHSGCDDWRLDCGEIKQRQAHILKTQVWTDCSFEVGEEPHLVTIKAHKLILAMASPVFEAMFYGPVAESNNPIPIPDIHPDTFQKMMEYIYTDNVELDSIDNAIKLYYGAQKYLITHLVTVCSDYLSYNITPEVVCTIYEFGRTVNDENLITKCTLIFQTKTSDVLNHKSFEEASLETVEEIFKMKSLSITSELVLFKAAEQYAQALKSKDLTSSPLDEKMEIGVTKIEKPQDDVEKVTPVNVDEDDLGKRDKENISNNVVPGCSCQTSYSKENREEDNDCKTLMRKVVRHIRFLTLTPAQLVQSTTLLTDSEILALMMNAGGNPQRPMPEGFSVSKEKRW